MNEAARDTFRTRTRIVQFIREFLNARDYLEVETPMMQAIPGGAVGAALRDPSQRAGHAAVPAHRPGAVSEAPGGRRLREGLRDQPQLPQRGAVHPAQPRVHDAGVLPGLCRLPGPDGPDRGNAARDGPGRARQHDDDLSGRDLRLRAAVSAHDGARVDPALQSGSDRRRSRRPEPGPRASPSAWGFRSRTARASARCRSRSSRRPSSIA